MSENVEWRISCQIIADCFVSECQPKGIINHHFEICQHIFPYKLTRHWNKKHVWRVRYTLALVTQLEKGKVIFASSSWRWKWCWLNMNSVQGVETFSLLWCGLWCADSRRLAFQSRTRNPSVARARPHALLCLYLQVTERSVKAIREKNWSVGRLKRAVKKNNNKKVRHLPLKFRLLIRKFKGANGLEDTIFPPEK